ncbi:MAG: helix-turn-helix transcriptional regulator [Lachnospiraceae bacterium]|nr:helix-turn-helix transcriptional regulator [Lachnospiraceae bacterium]
MENKIKEIRESKKMSMYRLAEKSGLSRSQIIKIEKMDLETSNIRLNSLLAISKGLDVSLFDLLGVEHKDIQRHIQKFDKKKIVLIKKIAKDLEVNIKVEDEE